MDITSAAVATLISAAISTAISLLIVKNNTIRHLDDQLDSLLKIAIQFPYLENSTFTESWEGKYDNNDEKMLRYEVYCTMVFNYLSRVCEHFKYNDEKVGKYIGMKDWVRLHRKYWIDPPDTYENIDTYDKQFVAMVSNYIKG